MKQAAFRVLHLLLALAAYLAAPAPAAAQLQGFQLNRYEPTAAGEWSFAVDHPRYSATGELAVGLTLDYSHNPFLSGSMGSDGTTTSGGAIISDQLVAHLDMAASFLNRLLLSISLPVYLYEGGDGGNGLTPTSGTAGDPRFGVLVRLFGHPESSRFSLSLGGYVFVPLRQFSDSLPPQAGDMQVRGLPKLVFAGLVGPFRYAATLGALIRADSILGTPGIADGSSTGTSLQVGAQFQYAGKRRHFAAGLELLLDTVLTNGHAFQSDYTGLELLFGGHYNVLKPLQLGAAVGLGFLSAPGTPDARLLLRAAYVLPDIISPPYPAPAAATAPAS